MNQLVWDGKHFNEMLYVWKEILNIIQNSPGENKSASIQGTA